MKIYAMSDIHGCLPEFDDALSLVDLSDGNKLILLGDYVHGPDSYGVLKRVMELQRKYGPEKIVALLGNHEEMVLDGRCPISEGEGGRYDRQALNEDRYLDWMADLPCDRASDLLPRRDRRGGRGPVGVGNRRLHFHREVSG